ncbi:Heme-binding protein 2 [Branchiostoma belcheri]|nr:Heme-binding protein 2 [Branchiostoma belcheri]
MPDGSGRAGSDGVPSLISGTAVRGKFVDAANCVGTVRTPFPAKDGQGRRPVGVSPTTMLMFLVLTTLASLAVTSPVLPSQTWPPAFCNKLECPKYTMVKSTKDYEERIYEAAKWTSTVVSGMEYNPAVSEGFMKLFSYIEGNNKKKVTIPMTAPVATKVEHGQGPYCKTNFTVSFFVPFADQTSPPEPSDPNVFTNPLEGMTAFVRSFGGFASDTDWTSNAEALAKSLDNATVSYHKDFYYTAGYNSPFQPTHRHNEVWYIKAD